MNVWREWRGAYRWVEQHLTWYKMEVSGHCHDPAASPHRKDPGTHWIGDRICPRLTWTSVTQRNVMPYRESNSGHPARKLETISTGLPGLALEMQHAPNPFNERDPEAHTFAYCPQKDCSTGCGRLVPSTTRECPVLPEKTATLEKKTLFLPSVISVTNRSTATNFALPT